MKHYTEIQIEILADVSDFFYWLYANNFNFIPDDDFLDMVGNDLDMDEATELNLLMDKAHEICNAHNIDICEIQMHCYCIICGHPFLSDFVITADEMKEENLIHRYDDNYYGCKFSKLYIHHDSTQLDIESIWTSADGRLMVHVGCPEFEGDLHYASLSYINQRRIVKMIKENVHV